MALADINIRFRANLQEFSTQMQSAQRTLKKTGRQFQDIGAKLTVGVTLPILGLGATALKAAADMETLKTSLDTVFKGNQELSTQAFDEIKEFASTTPFQLEEVAQAFIKLKNLGLDPSIDSLTSYGNTASALGKSLDQMIEAVADASVGEFERLKEFGIKAKSEGDNVSFTFQGVTTTVKKNSEEIQRYLLNIGNTQFTGSISRQADTFNGKLSTLRDNLTQAFAGIGEILIDYINPLFAKINEGLQWFQELSPTTKKWIVILGGIAAAIGPLLALAGTILPAIATGFAILTGPIGLIIAGLTTIGVIVVKKWAPIKKILIDIANYFIDLYNESSLIRGVVEGIVFHFKAMFEVGKFIFETLKNIIGGFVDTIVNKFTTFGKVFKAIFSGNFSEIPAIVKESSEKTKNTFQGFTSELAADWKNLTDGLQDNAQTAVENIARKKIAFLKENVEAENIEEPVETAVKNGVLSGLEKGFTEGAAGTGEGKISLLAQIELDNENADFEALNEDIGALEERLNEFGANTSEALAQAGETRFFDGLTNQYDEFLVGLDERNEVLAEKMQRLKEVGEAVGEAVGGAFLEIGNGIVESMGLADKGFQGFVKNLAGTVTKLISMMLAQALATSISNSAQSAAGTGPAAVFTQPVFMTTLISGVLAAFAAIPKFELGGIVGGNSFYGDKILARVNSGELILNRSQQERLYNQMQPIQDTNVRLSGGALLKGSDIYIALERYEKEKNRIS